MIKPDYTKSNYIPEGIDVEYVSKAELKPPDRVIILGEIFVVNNNEFIESRNIYLLQMTHETDPETMCNEHYVLYPENKKVMKRIL